MKCICGYIDKYLDKELKEVCDEPFIKIYSFLGNRSSKVIISKQIYACPKCGTLKIEVEN
jgi:hypothetical protein